MLNHILPPRTSAKAAKAALLLTPTAVLLLPAAAHAHHAEFMSGNPVLQGLSMPVHGLDHLLSALAVGLLAARMGGRARVQMPALFCVIALVGGFLNLTGVNLPECAVPLSVAAAGALLFWGIPTSAVLAGIVACAGLCNGQALLQTPSTTVEGLLFAAGCLTSALAMCGAGLLAGRLFENRPALTRLTGAALLASAALVTLFPALNGAVTRLIE